jgi:hypothetical protein
MPFRIMRFILGSPLNPFNKKLRENLALIAFFAWVGLGADALSSSCYGPEESFIALGTHSSLAIWISLATIVTIFIISMGYNQVIELFPNGGGGYKVVSKLLHPYAGLVAGCALIVDYVLTITVSIASGVDAIFSFLPHVWLPYILYMKEFFILLILVMNLRGIKEAIEILMPIFLGFFILHIGLIIYGVAIHPQGMSAIVTDAIAQTHSLSQSIGMLAVLGLILHAYSLGAGTYTGLESVANNVFQLSEPRVATGKRTMFYMAFSLSLMAGGIILLYLLWNVHPVHGQTLNAVVFHEILGNSHTGKIVLVLTLLLEAGLLFVAANTGFVGGPTVLANMATDSWVPHRFFHLSSRLVIQNGMVLLGLGALAILAWSGGDVSVLVVLYSINVFITFTLALLSISVYWIKNRGKSPHWKMHLTNALIGFITTLSILIITLIYKFRQGGWLTLLITSALIGLCILVKRHYLKVERKLRRLDKQLVPPLVDAAVDPPKLHSSKPTAVILVGKSLSMGMHTLQTALRLFPNYYQNFIFIDVGVVDMQCFQGEKELQLMKTKVDETLDYFVNYCHQYGMAARGYSAFGAEPMVELKKLARRIWNKYPDCMFFAGKIIFKHDNFITDFLHDQAALLFQRYLHFKGKELMILPMKI